MKKFSSKENIKINKKPEIDNSIDESTEIKYQLHDLINRYLSLETYGSIDNRFLGTVKIKGQEMLAEAILDFFNGVDRKSEVQILESLKSEIRDWETIDRKIDELSYNIDLNNRVKFDKLMEFNDPFLIESKLRNITDNKTKKDYQILIKESNLSAIDKKTYLNILNII